MFRELADWWFDHNRLGQYNFNINFLKGIVNNFSAILKYLNRLDFPHSDKSYVESVVSFLHDVVPQVQVSR